MRTDVKLLTIEDLCRELGVVYRDAGRRRKEIVAEIARRIEVRDRVVKHLLGEASTGRCTVWWSSGDDQVAHAVLLEQSNSVRYEHNGEQIL